MKGITSVSAPKIEAQFWILARHLFIIHQNADSRRAETHH